ncbi:MAG: type VI secretion system tube protein Hcp [archaeon]
MKNKSILLFMVVLLAIFSICVSAEIAHAAHNIFVDVDGISGESADPKHVGWIEATSYNHSIIQLSSSTAGSTGKGDFVIVKELDKSTPKLSQYLNSGKKISTVKVELVTSVGTDNTFMTYTLTNVVVSSITLNNSINDNMVVEEVSFSYDNIKWDYLPLGSVGDTLGTVSATCEEVKEEKSFFAKIINFLSSIFGLSKKEVPITTVDEEYKEDEELSVEEEYLEEQIVDEEVCGDQICQEWENCETCPIDCDECEPEVECGDQVCQEWENCETCPIDCDECEPEVECGDQICQEWENCETCPIDCDECEPEVECGDQICQEWENCETCPIDCEC